MGENILGTGTVINNMYRSLVKDGCKEWFTEERMKTLNDVTPEQWDSLRPKKTHPHQLNAQADVGIKHDKGKLRLDLIPVEAREALGRVLSYGAVKYEEDNNWRLGIAYSRVLGAAHRHLAMFEKGTDIDEESGLRHIDHALCNLAFLATFVEEGRKDLDDRHKKR